MSDALATDNGDLGQQLNRLGIEGLVLQQRLVENLARARMYGDTETTRAERAQLLDALNRLALGTAGKPYSALFPSKFGEFTRDAEGAVTFVGREHQPIIVGDSGLASRVLEAAREAGDKTQDVWQTIEQDKQAIASARERGDHQTEAIYLQELGLNQISLASIEQDQRQDHLSRAADALCQAMNLFDALDATPLIRARTRYHLGRCYHQSGRWHEAIALLEQAREVFSRHKARPELAHTLLELGQLYQLTQDFESASTYLKDALRLFRRINDTDGIAVTQETLGSLALQTARPTEAIVSLQEARRGYTALRRKDRVRAVDDLLHIAQQARQPVMGRGATP